MNCSDLVECWCLLVNVSTINLWCSNKSRHVCVCVSVCLCFWCGCLWHVLYLMSVCLPVLLSIDCLNLCMSMRKREKERERERERVYRLSQFFYVYLSLSCSRSLSVSLSPSPSNPTQQSLQSGALDISPDERKENWERIDLIFLFCSHNTAEFTFGSTRP